MAAIWSTGDNHDAKACSAFTSAGRKVDLRDRAEQEDAVRNVYAGIGWRFLGFSS